MPFSVPGVYVSEAPFKARATARASGATAAAFIGKALRGSITEPVLVRSWPEYRAQYGDLDNAFDLGFALYQYFANGGRDAYVVRAYGSTSTAASATITYSRTPASGASATGVLMTLDARNPGEWGNTTSTSIGGGLICQVTPGTVVTPITGPATTVATFNLRVLVGGSTSSGTEVEYWPDLSPDPNSSRYAPAVLNNYSNYVRVRAGQVDIAPFVGATSSGLTFSSTGLFTGGSTQDADVDATAYGRALDLLDTVSDSLLINVVGKFDTTTVNLALSKAQTRGTSFVIIDPNPASTGTSAITNSVSGYSPKGWGAPYYGMITMVDPSKSGIGAVRNTYPGGAVAGLYVRTEIERTVAKPPAGYNADIRNALGTVLNLTDSDIGTLYNAGVNCFKTIPGAGVVVLGARTLEPTKPDKYISIRRSLNYVKQRSIEVTRFAVFEPNDQRLWNAINVRLGSMLTDFWGAGGLKGRSPGEAFYVVCDESINTPAVIDAGEVRVQIGVALQYPGEFVVINISQLAGGISE